MENIKEIVEAWKMNNKGTLYLLANIETEWLSAKLAGKGRSIGEHLFILIILGQCGSIKLGKKLT